MLSLQAIRHRYDDRTAARVEVLDLAAGEPALLLGPSGSGKTTLLHIAAGLLRPSEGLVRIGGQSLTALDDIALDRFRGRHVGIVFQRLHLIGSLTVLQNLLAAQYGAGLPVDIGHGRATLAALGIEAQADVLPARLSQGQAQRAAVARATVNRPQLIVADEPTASLDDRNADAVLNLLQAHARACEAALLIATHDARAKACIKRQITLEASA
ncbi:ABC transporter ATP-binding protein [Solimonas marina]|uniref:ATP-binding cassette domain-containing protein n=1 Tax=Solimonas marina TaxID=2714601 RepID=A0A970B535_9GAMM|nr:ATP-binding cassette domain-containing protein [Solimonas marina]NKF21278.1 ATP-binding cassette domain-containing protein [Solimonas marina]